jgi:hypothetical protein
MYSVVVMGKRRGTLGIFTTLFIVVFVVLIRLFRGKYPGSYGLWPGVIVGGLFLLVVLIVVRLNTKD